MLCRLVLLARTHTQCARVDFKLFFKLSAVFCAQEHAFEQMRELFHGPFMESPHFAEFAKENLGFEVPPMNPDRLAELAEFTAKMSATEPSTSGAPAAVRAAGGSGAP